MRWENPGRCSFLMENISSIWIGGMLAGVMPTAFGSARSMAKRHDDFHSTATNVQYTDGYLLYSRDSDLFAQKFDLSHLELSGPELPVARNIQYDTFFEDASFTVSANGILVYAAQAPGSIRVDLDGTER